MCSTASTDLMPHRSTIIQAARAAGIAALALVACKGDGVPEGDRVVAEAYGERFYWSDLRQMIPPGTAPEDSAAMARRFIDNWARERVVLHKAEENISDDTQDVQRRLRSYRESLLTYTYEQALVKEKLDTVVNDLEVERYYEEHRKNFELKDNIVRARWFRLHDGDPKLMRRVGDLWRTGDAEAWHELEVLLARQGVTINDTHDEWIEFKQLQQQVPVRPQNPTDWLPRNTRSTVADSAGIYYLDILEQRLKDSVSPLPLVQRSIRAIIINQRKQQLIARMREDLYNDALARKDVRIH